jgi:SulP family sulfate permease
VSARQVEYRFNSDLFYADAHRFTDEVRSLVKLAPTPIRWFIVDAGAITDIDYSAARSIRDLLDDLARQKVGIVFARVSSYLRSDMDRHQITAAIGEARIFTTLHEAIVAVQSGALGIRS